MIAAARVARPVGQRLTRSVSTKINNPLTAEHVSFPNQSRPAFGISRFLQANFFRSNAIYIATVVFACVVGSGAYESAFNSAWEINNKGKLYKDIIKNYPGLPPNTEPEGGAAEPAAEDDEAGAEPAEEAAEE